MRIVSLLPSATEIICGLGLQKYLVGVTHECDYPAGVADLPKVTQTLIPVEASSGAIDQLVRERLQNERALYSLDLSVLEALKPDLIVTQALCDVCAVAESEVKRAACALPNSPQVINLEPSSLDEVFDSILTVAEATHCLERGRAYVGELQERVEAVAARTNSLADRPGVILLEWIDPPFTAGHWNPQLVRLAGGRELIGQENGKSVSVAWDAIRSANPDHLIISCCGFSVERTLQDVSILQAYPGWQELACVKSEQVSVVDGAAYFSRPGPRLVDSLEILAHALHPEIHPLPDRLSVGGFFRYPHQHI